MALLRHVGMVWQRLLLGADRKSPANGQTDVNDPYVTFFAGPTVMRRSNPGHLPGDAFERLQCCLVGKTNSLRRLIVAIQVDSLWGRRLAVAISPALSNEVA